ncbi:MAG: Gfo/Idh/MocA family protein [Alphaproteobacteria bacterium]
MKTIKLGFIGCGKISEKHFAALENLKDRITVQAVCDLNQDRATAAAQKVGAKAYTDMQEMLTSEDLDIVTIATPNGLHADHICQVADHGISVVTDKPIAITLEEGQRAVNHCREKEVQLFVSHQLRYNDKIQVIKNAIDQGRFGQIYMITANVFWNRNDDYYNQVPWHGTRAMDGGAYVTQASHFVDLMQWFAGGKPRSVYANLKTLARSIETEDTGISTFEWDNGIVGNLNVTMLSYNKNFESSMTILGEKGTMKIGGPGMNDILHWEFSEEKPEDTDIRNNHCPSYSAIPAGHGRLYEDVADALDGNEALLTGIEGLKSLELLQAINDSSAQKTVVNF